VRSLRQAFDELIDLSPSERAERLRDLRLDHAQERTLLAMLDAGADGPRVMAIPIDRAIDSLREDDELLRSLVGRKVGPFRVLDLIGEGGSSAVFRADRAAGSGSQIVALKLLRTGLFTAHGQQRFRREQAILAQLTHSNIARLVEGGISEAGIPYIAMEFVDGRPITVDASARGLGLAERLRMFVKLCGAIEAAHAALVVHRDIKPSNVFVDTHGELKVLDFGIAKLLDDDDDVTRTQATIALTPGYAAPEQYQPGRITIAADIYALGVLLGELVSGSRLGGTSGRTASATVLSNSAAPPNGLPEGALLARLLRGDIDAIIMVALADDPAMRYRSAGALADDIERFLAGQPVAPCATKPLVPAGSYFPATFTGSPAKAVEQTVASVRHDLDAVNAATDDPPSRVTLPGMRGGSTLVRRGALDLRNVSLFNGLRVSGKLSAAGNGTLRLRGKRAGVVKIRGFQAS